MEAGAAGPTPGRWLHRRVGVTLFLLLILVYWGIGLNYSFAYGLLEEQQTQQVIINYLWELPAIGIPIAVIVPLLMLRPVARAYDSMLRGEQLKDPEAVGRLLVSYPRRVVLYFTPASIAAYLIGNVTLLYTAHYPLDEFLKGLPLGLPLGLLFSLASYLALVHLLEPVRRAFIQRYGHRRAPPPMTTVHRKVVVTSVTIVALSLGLLWLIAFAQGQILLEDQLQARMEEGALPMATEAGHRWGTPWASEALANAGLGERGYAFLVDGEGQVVAGHPRGARTLAEEDWGDARASAILGEPGGKFASRIGMVRLVAYRAVPDQDLHAVVVTYRDDFAAPLADMSWAMLGATVLGLAIAVVLALASSRALTRPIQELNAAMQVMRSDGTGMPVGAMTDDELGALARSYDALMARLKEQRRELHDNVERMREMDALKTQFINIASHELRTPMTPIRTELHLLEKGLRGPLSPDQVKGLRMVKRNVDRLNRLILDLLEASRMQAGQLKLLPRPVELRDTLETALHTMQGEAAAKGVVLRKELGLQPGLRLLADEDRVLQVLINLMENAIQFTPAGGEVALLAVVHPTEVRVEVRDTGRGIEPHLIQRLFQPFSQAEPGVPRTEGGTGLGLFICKGIVEGHGGAVGCTSEGKGRGAAFWFTLPLTPAHEDVASFDPFGRAGLPEGGSPEQPRAVL